MRAQRTRQDVFQGGTDHPDHASQARLIRRYIAWRNYNADDVKLREVVNTVNVA